MERHYQDGTEPTILPHFGGCTGPCQQGRAACPCPESCEAALDESSLRLAGKAFLAIVLAGVVIAVGWAVS
jgi:hypothetical protein